jgi:hypothetical protein
LQEQIEHLVDRLLDAAADKGEIDLLADFASAIPVQLIGDMLGIPQDEGGPLRGWSLAILAILGALEPVLSPQQLATGVGAVAAVTIASGCAGKSECCRIFDFENAREGWMLVYTGWILDAPATCTLLLAEHCGEDNTRIALAFNSIITLLSRRCR